MKTIKLTVYRSYKQEIDASIDDVIHGLPTWMFPKSTLSSLKTACPVCNKEMRLNIAHGTHIGSCSFIKISNGHTTPIHTECYNSLEDLDYKINHFNQAEMWNAKL
jgi:hypothetical protein